VSTQLGRSDRGIVVSWLLKVSLVLVVIGVLLFEVVGVVVANGTASETARNAAQEAGFRYRDTSNAELARDTAREFVEKEGAEFVSLEIDPRDRRISVTVRKEAQTLFIQNIAALKKYTTATTTQSAPLPG
jgi:hypothetical protein